ncbi:MAG TPA: MFS transporter [Thermoplasmata archaeon]|nr:MFS transporter [Thermoplasmata archaeon]
MNASTVLRRPNFRRLWIGSVTSSLGAAVGTLVVTWLVYSTTGSALAVSLLGIVQFVPTLAFGLLAGALIDRLDRRRVLVGCDLARVGCFGALAVLVLLYGAIPGLLIGVMFAAATFTTVFRPATNATVPRILDREEVTEGNGLLQGGTTVAQFVGSPLGGVFLVTVGAVAGLAFNALTFAISATMILLMVIPSSTARAATAGPQEPSSLLGEVAAGLRYLRSQRPLLIITLSAMAANFFLSIWGGFQVVYVAVQLRQGAAGFGILVAATTAGFAVGAVLPSRLHAERAPGQWILPSWGSVGFFIVALAFVRSLLLAVPLEIAAGLLLSVGNTTWLSGVHRTVPDEYLGRYFATDEAGSFAMIPAGIALGGVFVFLYGISNAYLIAGVGTLLTNVFLVLSPSVWRWGLDESPTPRLPRS